jgi:hypothetical protein
MEFRTDFVFNIATTEDQLKNLKEKADFHAFNPNGLYARKRHLDGVIGDLIDAGTVPSGWALAYGVFSDYNANKMRDLASKKRVSGIDFRVATNLLRDEITRIENKITAVA